MTEKMKLLNYTGCLTPMNEKITHLGDRNYTLGHSYLMGISTFKDLKERFVDQIIPLLQEYFYDDWIKLQLVLGKEIVCNSEKISNQVFGHDVDELEESKTSYEVMHENIIPVNVRKIYETE